nr:immunoglobulin heavy chain junction region [Macaca mulatta]MOV56259.1 immunoglobulin heavy chain junction region [Macaca mulatta]MOV56288.1 immunoglobulin heavy chain junction region [Macaca mulatta]MOV59645.1 immunoglobulin heavy chain junction region [Macaca mulatta]
CARAGIFCSSSYCSSSETILLVDINFESPFDSW